MNKNIIILLFTIIAFSDIDAQVSEEKPFIEINGTAELEVIPNQIFIRIYLSENTDKSKKTIGEQEKDLIKALQSIQINPNKLVVTDANAYYGKTGIISKEVVSSKRFELEVDNATQARNVFEKLDKLNIKNASIARVDHTNLEEYKKNVKINAIKSAKEKANYLLKAIDQNLGNALIIRENNHNVNGLQFKANTSYSKLYNDSKPIVNLDFKKITLQSSIYGKWEIK